VTQIPGFLTTEGLDPSGSGKGEFRFCLKQVDHLLVNGPKDKYYEIYSAYDVLNNPVMIFEGLQRPGHEQSLCYVGRPRVYGDGVEYPPRPSMLFLVCMTVEKKIFEWRWEREDCNTAQPKNAKQRFGKLKWKQHSSNT
jgi:hypothetical protein